MANMQAELRRTVRKRLTLTARIRHAAATWTIGVASKGAQMWLAHLDPPPLAILTARARFSSVYHDQ